MRLVPVVTAVAAVLLCTHHATAFSVDSSSGTNPDGSARYADPDDQIHSMLGSKGGDSQNLGYDANSDHRKPSPQEIINGQGVLAPGFFFSTAPSRR
jgi:hypothetical protein